MSKTMGGANLADIIQLSTQEIVDKTTKFLESIEGDADGDDAISVMLNGKETLLSPADYAALKVQTAEIKAKRKMDIGALTKQFKEHRGDNFED